MTRKIAPSILAADFKHLGDQLSELEKAGAQYIHIDVMDGSFVPEISFGQPVIESIRSQVGCIFDVHIMAVHPERHIPSLARSGADSITFHLEAVEDPASLIQMIRNEGKRVGISIKPATPVEAILPYLDQIDMLLIMTVEPGFGGQAYIPESTQRIKEARKLFTDAGLDTDIEVDGGIKIDNVEIVLEAGANVIVAGSAIFSGNLTENVKAFLEKFTAV